MTRYTILIADESESRARPLVAALSAAGHDAWAVPGAGCAFEELTRRAPSMVLLAADLADDSAIALHEQIRRLDDGTIPVAYLAWENADDVRERTRGLAPAAVMDASVSTDVLSGLVVSLLDVHPATAPTGRGTTMRILVVEDDRMQRRLIEKCLKVPGRETIEIVFGDSVASGCDLIRAARYDCVVVDHELPDGRGIEVLEEAEEQLLTTPVIGLSASADADIAVEYFRSGCADFLFKQDALQADVLRRGISGAMSRFQRRTMASIIERKQLGDAIVESQEKLISLARVDHLMGICNRAVFDDYHPDYHREMTEHDGRYAVCMIDVDNFKAYNDHYGHAAGDEALRRVAQTILRGLRDEDFVARYGGEEIVVVLADVTPDQALMVGDRTCRLLREQEIPHIAGSDEGVVTISVGVSCFDAAHPCDRRAMLLRADEALYEAKRTGRNRAVLAPAGEACATAA